ncbi:hypothetical protein EV122DRAFT_272086 [Schizophyllum commune]
MFQRRLPLTAIPTTMLATTTPSLNHRHLVRPHLQLLRRMPSSPLPHLHRTRPPLHPTPPRTHPITLRTLLPTTTPHPLLHTPRPRVSSSCRASFRRTIFASIAKIDHRRPSQRLLPSLRTLYLTRTRTRIARRR